MTDTRNTDQTVIRRALRWLLRGSLTLLITLLFLELLLMLVDPLGATAYYDVAKVSIDRVVPHPQREYTFPEWTAVSGTNDNADCTIAFIGDSFTQGLGVDPSENFVSRLAPSLDAHVINTGVFGYNLRQIYHVYQSVEADGYVYLMLDNDVRAMHQFDRLKQAPAYLPAFIKHIVFFRQNYIGRIPVAEHPGLDDFITRYEQLQAQPNVLTVAESDTVLTNFVPVDVVIDPMTDPISLFDSHPNPAGHRHIADEMRLAVQSFVERVCAES